MKKLALLTIIALAMLGCNGTPTPDGPIAPTEGDGVLRLALAPESDITVVEEKSSEQVDVNSFEIDILDAAGASYAKYASYSQVPQEVNLPAGTYSISATSGRLKSASFDEPHYAGIKAFNVEVGKTAEVSIGCVITNVKVTIEYSTKILETLTDIKASVSSAYDEADATKIGRLNYTPAETRAGWFAKPANKQIEVYVTGTNKQTGLQVSTKTTLSGVESRQWRKVKLDIKTSGGADVVIEVDETLVQKPATDVIVPDSDEVIDNNGDNGNWDEKPVDPDKPEPPVDNNPTIVGVAFGDDALNAPFSVDEEIEFTVGVQTVLDVLMSSKAEGGITNLFLTIESESLADLLGPVLGITGKIDLANPEPGSTWAQMFAEPDIALIDPAVPIKGKAEHTFSVGKLMALLGAVAESGLTHQFHLELVDANGSTQKTLSIVLHKQD